MSQCNIRQLQARDIDLYEDICTSNSIVPQLEYITKRQIEFLLSIREIVVPYTPYTGIRTTTRLWKVLGKTKQGGHLTQSFAQKFFLSEK